MVGRTSGGTLDNEICIAAVRAGQKRGLCDPGTEKLRRKTPDRRGMISAPGGEKVENGKEKVERERKKVKEKK